MKAMQKTGKEFFAGKKVLILGLGLLGGGVAATNWFLKHGAKITVTDLKTKKQLATSIKRVRGKVRWSLGSNKSSDIRRNEIIALNPDVSINNPLVKLAKKLGRRVENEATVFYRLCNKPIIAITGTRGKTTTANWTGHFLKSRLETIVTGNSYIEPLLKSLDKITAAKSKIERVVNEIPSYHLELFDAKVKPPQIAVITNIFQDHLNRHGTLKNYALTKAGIFKNQKERNKLVLNFDDKWTGFFLKQKPKARIWFFSAKPLPKKLDGVFWKGENVWLQKQGQAQKVISAKDFARKWGEHNIRNLLASSLAAHLGGANWEDIQKQVKTLPTILFRQQIIFKRKKLVIVNDSAATSPDGAIAAAMRFRGNKTIFIAGGTDRQLDFKEWGRVVSKCVDPENIILLNGSATKKMIKGLGKKAKQAGVFESLSECLRAALAKAKKIKAATVVFSPGAKSFEKFQNEFDRGNKFNKLVKKLVKKEVD